MNPIRYSIIVPIYNAGSYLRECLDSVQLQSYRAWECICVDDGSSDDSPVIADEYAAKDSRFKVLHLPHGGVGKARNAGMSAASGEYIVFVDADDSLEPFALESLKNETDDIVTFLPLRNGMKGRCERSDELALAFFDALAGNLLVWNAIYRRERLGDLRFPNFVNCEDLVFAAEAYAKAQTIVAGVDCWYCHRQVAGSASNTHSWRRVKDTWKSLWMMYRAYRPAIKGVKMRIVLARKLTMHLLLHILAEIPLSIGAMIRGNSRQVGHG